MKASLLARCVRSVVFHAGFVSEECAKIEFAIDALNADDPFANKMGVPEQVRHAILVVGHRDVDWRVVPLTCEGGWEGPLRALRSRLEQPWRPWALLFNGNS